MRARTFDFLWLGIALPTALVVLIACCLGDLSWWCLAIWIEATIVGVALGDSMRDEE